MKIEKIKNYNQNVLAILGTLVVLIAIVGLILILFFAITEIGRSMRYNDQDDGILSDEKIEELQNENKRQQLVSYNFPRLTDTINLIYIIPVSHKTLNNPEYINDGNLGLMDYSGSSKLDKRYSSSYYGSFSNLLIYDFNKNEITKLFDERVNFAEINTEYFDDDIIILFVASSKDTYKDGVINLKDYKSLYLYSLNDKELKQIKLENTDIYNYSFVENKKDLLIQFGIDHNNDGQFEYYREPLILKRYNYLTGELEGIIDNKISDQLQKSLEGSIK